jgi:hypothetical protein
MIADMFIGRRRRLNALGGIYDGITSWWRDPKCPHTLRYQSLCRLSSDR